MHDGSYKFVTNHKLRTKVHPRSSNDLSQMEYAEGKK